MNYTFEIRKAFKPHSKNILLKLRCTKNICIQIYILLDVKGL